MSKKAGFGGNHRPLIAVVLIAAAAVMLFLAWQSMSTDQYKLYSRNYDYYVTSAQECRAMEENTAGYAYLANEWEESARIASTYLTQHRAGAASLAVVSFVCIGFAASLLLKRKKADGDQPAKEEKA